MTVNLLPPELGIPRDLLIDVGRYDRELGRIPPGNRLPQLIAQRAAKQQWVRACLAAGEFLTNSALNSAMPPARAQDPAWRPAENFIQRVCSPLQHMAQPYQAQVRAELQRLVRANGTGGLTTRSANAARSIVGVPRSIFNRTPSIFGAIADALSPFGPYSHLDPIRLKAENPFKTSKSTPARTFDKASADKYTTYYAPQRATLRMNMLRCNTPTESDGDEAYLLVGGVAVDPIKVAAYAKSGDSKDLGRLAPVIKRIQDANLMLSGSQFVPNDVLADARINSDGVGLWTCSYALWEDDMADATRAAENVKMAGEMVEEMCSDIGEILASTGNAYAEAAGAAIEIAGVIANAVCQIYAVLVTLTAREQPLGIGSMSSDVLYAYYEDQPFEATRYRAAHLSGTGYDYVIRFAEERTGRQTLQQRVPPAGTVIVPKVVSVPPPFHLPEGHDVSYFVGDKGDLPVHIEWKGYAPADAKWQLNIRGDTAKEQVSATELRRRHYSPGDVREAIDGGGKAQVNEVYVDLSIHWWYNAWGIWSLNSALQPVGGNGRCDFSITAT
ncbi:hypothetical protein [Sorangium atrum]|uniref:Uncharacterized protein n=1 Tax=Sorangium atrum TaxID=2995308 RepID=A0ABT5C524_9BACT|nr:hypothetical protein [Sorangium aterium]MDC0681527.1 hypothetical protein [Sorangium aterium]